MVQEPISRFKINKAADEVHYFLWVKGRHASWMLGIAIGGVFTLMALSSVLNVWVALFIVGSVVGCSFAYIMTTDKKYGLYGLDITLGKRKRVKKLNNRDYNWQTLRNKKAL